MQLGLDPAGGRRDLALGFLGVFVIAAAIFAMITLGNWSSIANDRETHIERSDYLRNILIW